MGSNNRGFLRVPRSRRKSEREKMAPQVLERVAQKASEEFERAARRVCGITVKLMLEELSEITESDAELNEKQALRSFIEDKSKQVELMISGG